MSTYIQHENGVFRKVNLYDISGPRAFTHAPNATGDSRFFFCRPEKRPLESQARPPCLSTLDSAYSNIRPCAAASPAIHGRAFTALRLSTGQTVAVHPLGWCFWWRVFRRSRATWV